MEAKTKLVKNLKRLVDGWEQAPTQRQMLRISALKTQVALVKEGVMKDAQKDAFVKSWVAEFGGSLIEKSCKEDTSSNNGISDDSRVADAMQALNEVA